MDAPGPCRYTIHQWNRGDGLPQYRQCFRRAQGNTAFCRQHQQIIAKDAVLDTLVQPFIDRAMGIVEGSIVRPALPPATAPKSSYSRKILNLPVEGV